MKKLGAALAYLTLLGAVPAVAETAAPDKQELLDSRPDIQEVSTEDKAMNAAIAQAQRTLPAFVTKIQSHDKNITETGFKHPLAGWEHIWASDVTVDGQYLVGNLSNEPAQPGYKIGDKVRVKMSDVSDWGYRNAQGVMQGNFTTRVLLDIVDPQTASEIRSYNKW